MSHSVKITLIADQYIQIKGQEVNIYDIETLVLDGAGVAVDVRLKRYVALTEFGSESTTVTLVVSELLPFQRFTEDGEHSDQ